MLSLSHFCSYVVGTLNVSPLDRKTSCATTWPTSLMPVSGACGLRLGWMWLYFVESRILANSHLGGWGCRGSQSRRSWGRMGDKNAQNTLYEIIIELIKYLLKESSKEAIFNISPWTLTVGLWCINPKHAKLFCERQSDIHLLFSIMEKVATVNLTWCSCRPVGQMFLLLDYKWACLWQHETLKLNSVSFLLCSSNINADQLVFHGTSVSSRSKEDSDRACESECMFWLWKPEVNVRIAFPIHFFTLLSWLRASHWSWSSVFRLDWLAS